MSKNYTSGDSLRFAFKGQLNRQNARIECISNQRKCFAMCEKDGCHNEQSSYNSDCVNSKKRMRFEKVTVAWR